jgi:hypothetical protein
MKRLCVAVVALGIALTAGYSQTNEPTKKDQIKKLPKPKKQDVILFNFNWMTMLNAPKGADDKLWISPFSRGFDVALMYDIPLGRSMFSFATGVNFSFENIFTNQMVQDSGANKNVYFTDIDPLINPDNPNPRREWQKAKIATAIIELPVEFRFRLKPHKRNTFKIAIGFKLGYVIDTWQKYEGPNYLAGEDLTTTLRQVTYDVPAVSRLRYGVYGRIGYSRFNAFVHYSISPFFENRAEFAGRTGNVFTVGFNFAPF